MKTEIKLKLLFNKAAIQIANFELPQISRDDPGCIDAYIISAGGHADSLKATRQKMEDLVGLCRDEETRTSYTLCIEQIKCEERLWDEFTKEMRVCKAATDISKKQARMAKILEDIRSIRAGEDRNTGEE